MATRKARPPAAADVRDGVERVLGDERVVWFGVKHYSPACARQVERLIHDLRPVAVLVEGPEDATPLIPWITHPDTAPPLTIFSVYVDHKNVYGLNGTLSPSEDIPARYRSWWPMAAFCPEYTALRAGAAIGAELAFIDLPVPGRIPFTHARRVDGTEVVGDHHLATSAYFGALQRRQRRRDFEEFWRANFERAALDGEAFRRAVLTFAWCARYAGADPGAAPGDGGRLDDDGTLTREAHMRWHVDAALKRYEAGRVLVVTGAFHSVALPFTRGRRAKFKADRNLETLLTPYGFKALARLYHMARTPGYEQAVWDAITAGEARPYDAAALRLLVEIMRRARAEGEAVSTADAVAAWHAARELAGLRGNDEVTAHDLLDACQMGYVKGERHLGGAAIRRAAHALLVGHRHGYLTPEAGVLPLLGDFHAEAKTHRLDLSGEHKTVRLDLHRQEKHRAKSAFLHRCDWLDVPLFGQLDDGGHFKGPDPISGEDMHLITETWAIRWQEAVDDRLVELAAEGATLAEAATARLRGALAEATDDAAASTALLLRCAQMRLNDAFDDVLDAVDAAIEADARFTHLVDALDHFVVLHAYRGALATHGLARLIATIGAVYLKAVQVLAAVANVDADALPPILDRLLTLCRIAVTFDAAAFDRALLIEALDRIATDDDGAPALRGAAFGLLYGFGAARERRVAAALTGYLRGAEARLPHAGAFLDGLFQASRSVFLRSPRLLRAVDEAVAALDWETFKVLLPDLRRAFTRFIPSELDRISTRVAAELGLRAQPPPDAPVPPALARVAATLDARVTAALAPWL
ncbi:MAG: DUF5682 family protein [bacterium]